MSCAEEFADPSKAPLNSDPSISPGPSSFLCREYPPIALIAALATAYPSQAEDTLSIDIYAIPSPSIVDAVTEASVGLAARGMTMFHA